MIKVDEKQCEFKYPVDTDVRKLMHAISPKAFELSCIIGDMRRIMSAIDKEYGKGCALKVIDMIVPGMYTTEDIENVEKETFGHE